MRQDQVEALVEDIFQRLDTNQDGVVTIDEFIEACQRVRNHPYITSEKGQNYAELINGYLVSYFIIIINDGLSEQTLKNLI